MRIFRYDTLTSTNTEASRIASELSHGDTIVAYEQTSGRGQRGNSWESEPGKNLTFSLFLRPDKIEASKSFLLSMAVSVGIVNALKRFLPDENIEIKWPNDIYLNDRKLAGILIENTFVGSFISQSIVGIGLNVNQKKFVSDAPNPVSMSQIMDKEFDKEIILKTVVESIILNLGLVGEPKKLQDYYHSSLWRREGEYLWCEPEGHPFKASIIEVKPSGHLVLENSDGVIKSYLFKEVFPYCFH